MMKFEASGSDSVYGDLQYISKNNPAKIMRNWVAGEFKNKKLLNGWMPPHPSFFVKRKCYLNFGLFNTSYHISSDYDLMLRFLGKHQISTTYIPKVLVKMRTGGKSNRSLNNIFIKSKEDFKALKENEIGNIYTLLLKNFRKLNQFF